MKSGFSQKKKKKRQQNIGPRRKLITGASPEGKEAQRNGETTEDFVKQPISVTPKQENIWAFPRHFKKKKAP